MDDELNKPSRYSDPSELEIEHFSGNYSDSGRGSFHTAMESETDTLPIDTNTSTDSEDEIFHDFPKIDNVNVKGTVSDEDMFLIDDPKEERPHDVNGTQDVTHNNSWQVLKYEELPEWLMDNPGIQGCYRPFFNSYWKCATSLFRLHNETVNIWSHLLPAISVVAIAYKWLWKGFEGSLDLEELFVIMAFFIGAFCCFTFSTIYHCFSCHSERALYICLKFDYSGIILMVIGSYFPWVYYAYRCHTYLRLMFYVFGVLLGVTAALICLTNFFDKVENRSVRAAVFFSMALCCFSAVVVYIFMFGLDQLWQFGKFQYIIVMCVFYSTGLTFYTFRIPERIWPGAFNILGHSHQLFHICVVLGAATYWKALTEMYNDREVGRVCLKPNLPLIIHSNHDFNCT